MPKNPFLQYQQFVTKQPRNSVDLSHRYNGTFAYGYLYPALCLEVDNGDSFSIDAAFGLKFMPMPFPVQTPMRATLQFYYVRNRNLCKDWEDFIYNNKSADVIPHPYISQPSSNKEFWKTGSLSDYLDVPTTIVTHDGTSVSVAPAYGYNYLSVPVGKLSRLSTSNYMTYVSGAIPASNNIIYPSQDPRAFLVHYERGAVGDIYPNVLFQMVDSEPSSFAGDDVLLGFLYGGFDGIQFDDELCFSVRLNGTLLNSVPSDLAETFSCVVFIQSSAAAAAGADLLTTLVALCRFEVVSIDGATTGSRTLKLTFRPASSPLEQVAARALSEHDFSDGSKLFLFIGQTKSAHDKFPAINSPWVNIALNVSNYIGFSAVLDTLVSNESDLSSGHFPNPFADDGNGPRVALNSYPYRAYESVYNAYFRNERLEPLMIDGVPEYNKYCPNMNSGADTFEYKLHQRNWESDYLTSSLPTPQQGIAPVVGVTGLDNIQIQDPDTNEIYNFKAEVAGDGETIVGGSFHSPDASNAARRTAQDIITAGFTINDFRNVSALQRFLENNIRRGLKYKDQVLANTGVKIRYDELDMPEFLGGFSRPVQVSSITQTAPGELGVGNYAGQANCFGQSKHQIRRYCDEKGWIIGIFCVTPMPVYSQLLPKHFLKKTSLDYHHPVFNHIGPQPITYEEVCPLQVSAYNPEQASTGVRFNDVFGYQRPYYDLLQHVDTVHGQMRTTLRDYVMNRTFSGVPELGADFIHVDPKQLNQVFNVTHENEDVIMGEIYFRIFAKRQVSLFGQPKIV